MFNQRENRFARANGTALCAAATLLITLSPSLCRAVDLDFGSGFGSTTGLQLNGDAATTVTGDGTVMRLTPDDTEKSGSFFTTTQLDVSAGFALQFSFRMTNPVNHNSIEDFSADGLVFVLQTDSSAAGSSGVGIGYEGISGPSVAVEFDSFGNIATAPRNDPDTSHVSVLKNTLGLGSLDASVDHLDADNSGFTPVAVNAGVTGFSGELDDGQQFFAWIDYDALTDSLSVFLSESATKPGTALLTETVDISAVLGQDLSFVGFTSATGGEGANHDIVSLELQLVPSPAALPMGLGMIAMLALRRRRA